MDLVVSLAANGGLFWDLPSICALRQTSKAHVEAWSAVLLRYFRQLCDLDRACRLLAAKERLDDASDLDLDALTHCIHSLVLRMADLEKQGQGREEMSLVWCNGAIADQRGDCGPQVFYDLVFVNEFAAEVAFASGGAEWTEDLTGRSERVRVYRYPPPGWDLGWSKKNKAPCYWKQHGDEVSAVYPGKKTISGVEQEYVFNPGPAESIGMCVTEDGFITEVLPQSQAAAHGIEPLSFVHRVGGVEVCSTPPTFSPPGHESQVPSCAWNLVRRCRLGGEAFKISILRRPRPNLDDLGLYRPAEDRMHLPPDWVEVVPPGWGMQGKSYYKNSWTGQCCEFQPLPHPVYPRHSDSAERCKALKALMAWATADSPPPFKRSDILRLLRDYMHDMHEPLRQQAIRSLGQLSKLGRFNVSEIFACLESRAFDDSPVVLNALIEVLETWQPEAAQLRRKHQGSVQAHRQKFPDGYGFRMDVNDFFRGLTQSDDETGSEDSEE